MWDSSASSGLGVAGDAARERRRQADGGVERQDGDRRGATGRGAEAGEGGAQHVHPGVAPGHHRRGRDGVLDLPARGLRHTGQLGDAGPEPARGAQLGDGEELVRRCGVTELELPAGDVGGEAALLQRPQVGDAGGQRTAQLLGVRPAGVVVGQRVDGHRPHAGVLAQAPGDQRLQRGEVGRGTGAGLHRQGVQTEVAEGRGRVGEPVAPQRHQLRRRVGGAGAGVQHHGGEVEQHVGEDLGQVTGRDAARADAEPERGHAVLEVGQHRLPGRRRVRVGEVLADVPALLAPAGRPAAPDVRRDAGEAAVGRRVVGGVERTDAHPVVRRGAQHGLGRRRVGGLREAAGAAQDRTDEAPPLLGGRRGEALGQRQRGAGVVLLGQRSLLGAERARVLGRRHCRVARQLREGMRRTGRRRPHRHSMTRARGCVTVQAHDVGHAAAPLGSGP